MLLLLQPYTSAHALVFDALIFRCMSFVFRFGVAIDGRDRKSIDALDWLLFIWRLVKRVKKDSKRVMDPRLAGNTTKANEQRRRWHVGPSIYDVHKKIRFYTPS